MKRKHPNSRSRNKKIRTPIIFTNPPSWLDDDTLSNFPDDCLYKILSHLDKFSLERLARTNQRMYYIVNQMLSKMEETQRILQKLEIVRNTTGCVVVATAAENDSVMCYVDQTNTQYISKQDNDLTGLRILDADPFSFFTIEEAVQTQIKKLTNMNNFEEIRFNGISLDDAMIQCCKMTGNVQKIQFQGIYEVTTPKLFIRWILHSGAKDVSFSVLNRDIIPPFNERFLINFARNRNGLSLRIDQESESYLNSIRSVDFFHGFEYLKHSKLVLTYSQFLQAVNRRLSKNRASGEWEFTLDHINSPYLFFQLHNSAMARQIYFPGVFTCGRTDNSNSVRIVTQPPSRSYLRNRFRQHRFLSLVTVTFFDTNQWLYDN